MSARLDLWEEKSETFRFHELTISHVHEGSGQNLLCIHGFPTAGFDFDPMWSGLIEDFNCVAPDLIGLGNSSKPDQPLPVSLQADMLEALCMNLGWTKAHILAHDVGDTISQELLARGPKSKIKWKSCIFLNGGLFPETHQPILIQKLLISPLGKWIAKLSSEKTFRASMNRIFSPNYPPSEDFLSDNWGLLVQNQGRTALPRLVRYMKERKQNRERWVGILQTTSVSITLINGSLDPISGSHAAAHYKDLVPNPRVVHLDDLGHYPHVENPEIILKEIKKFHIEIRS